MGLMDEFNTTSDDAAKEALLTRIEELRADIEAGSA
jgi:hypothetical protein